jgi:hypothetical protein
MNSLGSNTLLPLIITSDLATGRGEDVTVQVTGTFPDEALLYDLKPSMKGASLT